MKIKIMRATSIIISLILLSYINCFTIGNNQPFPSFSNKELNNSRIKIFTKDDRKITGYLVNADSDFIYFISDKVDVNSISSPTSGSRMPIGDIKKIHYPKNKVGKLLLGLLCGGLSFLLILAGAISASECKSNCNNVTVTIFSAILFFGFLGLTASSLKPAEKTKDSLQSTLALNDIRSRSLWRALLDRKYLMLDSVERYSRLYEEGYINQYKTVTIKRKHKPNIKGFISSYDADNFYLTKEKNNLVHAIIYKNQAAYIIKREDIKEIKF